MSQFGVLFLWCSFRFGRHHAKRVGGPLASRWRPGGGLVASRWRAAAASTASSGGQSGAPFGAPQEVAAPRARAEPIQGARDASGRAPLVNKLYWRARNRPPACGPARLWCTRPGAAPPGPGGHPRAFLRLGARAFISIRLARFMRPTSGAGVTQAAAGRAGLLLWRGGRAFDARARPAGRPCAPGPALVWARLASGRAAGGRNQAIRLSGRARAARPRWPAQRGRHTYMPRLRIVSSWRQDAGRPSADYLVPAACSRAPNWRRRRRQTRAAGGNNKWPRPDMAPRNAARAHSRV